MKLSFTELAELEFKPFSDFDYSAYAGVQSKNPLIAESSTDTNYKVYIIDGDVLQVITGKLDMDCDETHVYNFNLQEIE